MSQQLDCALSLYWLHDGDNTENGLYDRWIGEKNSEIGDGEKAGLSSTHNSAPTRACT